MGDYEVRDNWGRKIGTARPVGQGSGCGGFIVLGIILLVGIVFLCQATANLLTYHKFTFDTGEAQREAATATAAPYHFQEDATSAKKSGNTSVSSNPSYPDEKDVVLSIGASLTFDGVAEPEDGTYLLVVYGTADPYGAKFTINVLVNGKLQTKLDETKLDRFADPSLQPTVQLHKGNNTITLLVETGDTCYQNGICARLLIQSLTVDKKF